MSIFSKIKSAYNTVKSALGFGGNQSANAVSATSTPKTNTGLTSPTGQPVAVPRINYGAGVSSSAIQKGLSSGGGLQQLPVTISAGQQKVGGGGGGGSLSGGLTSDFSAYFAQPTTRTISSNSTLGGGGGGGGGGSLGTPVPNLYSLQSAPNSVNANIDNTKVAGLTAGLYKMNENGVLEEVKEESDTDTAQRIAKAYKDAIGVEPSVYDDPQVIEAQRERQRIREQLQAPVAELNAVLAQQQRDLLQLRKTGSEEGVTEAVYGGQSNAINYNAAIRALPLQASIASLQGDLQLAQDYLSELTQVKREQIKNQYDYNTRLFTAIESAITKKDERKYQELKTANDRAYKEQDELVDFQNELITKALKQKASQSVISRISNSKTKRDALLAAGDYAFDSTASVPTVKSINGVDMQWNPSTGTWETPTLGNVSTGTTLSLAQAQGNVELIDSLTTDPYIRTAVGPSGPARFVGRLYDTLTGGRQNFIASVEQIRSNLNLEALIGAKAKGATFGALSNQELQVLASAASKIGTWAKVDENGKVIAYSASERDFKKELDKINNFAKLDYIRKGGDPMDVNAQLQSDGTIWTTNSDGTLTQIQ